MKRNPLLLVSLVALLFGCSAGKQSTGVWVNTDKIQGKSFNKIFIIVMTANIEARTQLENDLAAIAIAKGYNAVKSIDVMPPVFSDVKIPTKEEIVSKVKAGGCDAVFVASLLKKEEEVHHTQGTTSYSMLPYYTWSGQYYGYYSHWYPTVYTPGYYTHEKNYFMQSNLYDVASEEVMWSVQSEIFNPSSIKKFSAAYTSTLLAQLEKEKLLKK